MQQPPYGYGPHGQPPKKKSNWVLYSWLGGATFVGVAMIATANKTPKEERPATPSSSPLKVIKASAAPTVEPTEAPSATAEPAAALPAYCGDLAAAKKEAKALLAAGQAMSGFRQKATSQTPQNAKACGENMRDYLPRAEAFMECTRSKRADEFDWTPLRANSPAIRNCVTCTQGSSADPMSADWWCADAAKHASK